MKVYMRKIKDHDISKEINITREVFEDFFENKNEFLVRGKQSQEELNVTLNFGQISRSNDGTPKEFRFDSNIKKIIKAENGFESGNIILIVKNKTIYELEVIKQHTDKYNHYDGLFIKDNHIIVDVDSHDNSNLFDVLSPEWFKEKSIEFIEDEKKAQLLYDSFRERFAPSKLQQLNGIDLLETVFYNDSKTYMYYYLEHDKTYRLFGRARVGASNQYGVYKDKKTKEWKDADCSAFINEEEAIKSGKAHIDTLMNCVEIIEKNKNNVETLSAYVDMDKKVMEKLKYLITKQMPYKYFHMIYPEIYPPYYSSEWIKRVLETLKLPISDDRSENIANISIFIKKCEISSFVFSRILYKYVYSKNNTKYDEALYEDNNLSDDLEDTEFYYNGGEAINLVIYGTPGCGKSYILDKILKESGEISINELKYKGLGLTENRIVRTTFHHDYSNTDFVGQIVPQVKSDGSATYVINPGPFTKALTLAFNTGDDVALVIEELNRGDAAGILGDIFQLLDRYKETDEDKKQYKGVSQYPIENNLIQAYLTEHTDYVFDNIRIPSNFYIFATMNTSDQNVFTLDTAFKRRWDFLKMKNNYIKYNIDCGNEILYVPGSNKKWTDFVEQLNKKMLKLNGQINEDKQLGLYFVDKDLLAKKENEYDEEKTKKFAFKVLEYLWDDVVRCDRQELFDNRIETLDDLVDKFVKLSKENKESTLVFKDGTFNQNENE